MNCSISSCSLRRSVLSRAHKGVVRSERVKVQKKLTEPSDADAATLSPFEFQHTSNTPPEP